jgi:hypothetical protein
MKKSGAQSRKDKARRDLLTAANQPSQKKLCFSLPQSEDTESVTNNPTNDPPLEVMPNLNDIIETAAANASQTSTSAQWPIERQAKLDLLAEEPFQPKDNIPFFPDIFNVKETDGSIIQRKWLTYTKNKLYCKVCGCFSQNRQNDFVLGFGEDNFRRASQCVKRHEVTQSHVDASDCYFRNLAQRDIVSLMPGWKADSEAAARKKVFHNRQVLDRIIDVIKVIVAQGLPFRGESESACDMLDPEKRHGNFIEMVLLLSRYDTILENHVAECYEKGQQQGKGRGSTITFLSKTTVCNIIKVLSEIIQEKVVQTIKDKCHGKYGVMADGTVDIAGIDQFNIIARFVGHDGKVQERLLGLEVITSGKGEDLWKLIADKTVKLGLDITSIIGLSLDGASANTSTNVGLVKYYHDTVPDGYFVWGVAHQQNLVISPVLNEIKEPRNLIGLLQETCSFFNESSTRMDVWNKWVKAESVGSGKLRKLVKLGKTRWWSAFKAISRICDEPQSYFILLGALWELSTCAQSSVATKRLSDGLLTKYLKFGTLLTAIVLRKILAEFNPVTNYLQTRGLDLSKAIEMVNFEQNIVMGFRTKFQEFYDEAEKFELEVQDLIDKNESKDFDLMLESKLPQRAVRRKKHFFDEAPDEPHENGPKDSYKVDTFLPVIDRLTGEISTRFNERNSELYAEMTNLNPMKYHILADPNSFSMHHLAALSNVDESELKEELVHFAKNHQHLGKEVSDSECAVDSDSEDEPLKSEKGNPFCQGNCANCLGCILTLLTGYRLHCRSYNKLYQCLKTALTLPCTVVSCERVFSKLRFIKSRLRALLGQELLESLLLCNVEVDMLKEISNESVYKKLSLKSSEFKKLLMYP